MEAATEKKSIYIVYGGPTDDLRPQKTQKPKVPKGKSQKQKREKPKPPIT